MFRPVTLWAVTLLVCCAGARAAGANGGDPVIIIAGGDNVASSSASFPLGSVFSILSPTGTSPLRLPGGSPCEVAGIEVPLCLFSNGTDFTWTTLTFSITPSLPLPPFTCLYLAYFSSCQFSDQHKKVTFSGGMGIAAGDVFLFAVVGWLPNTTFSGNATGAEASSGTSWRPLLPRAPAPRPQPSTAELFLGGQVALRDHCRLRVVADSATRSCCFRPPPSTA
jgi:hypothetical protein